MDQFLSPKTTFGNELRFSPYAYGKLIWMRDRGKTEVAGYGITATKDPLLVTDFVLVKQKCNHIHFELDPEDNAEHTERMMDIGVPPWACMNLLIHSHPGNSPHPSPNDEDNFKKAFARPNWAIMLIIAKDGSTYCRLKMNTAPGVEKLLKVVVDWNVPFEASNKKAWEEEYKTKVVVEEYDTVPLNSTELMTPSMEDPLWKDLLDEGHQEFGQPEGYNEVDCYWDEDGEVRCWDDKTDSYYTYDPVADSWREDNGLAIVLIDTPNEPFVEQVKAWASKYADERVLAIDA